VRVVRRGLVVVAIALAVPGVVLAGEAWLAQRGRNLPDPPPEPLGDGSGPVVVWLGDSTAAGVGASAPAFSLPEQVAARLGQPVRLTVLARSGARVADVLRSQLPQVARLQPSEVFISVGANDATHFTRRSHFRRDYARLLAGLPGTARLVVLGVPDLGSPHRLAQPLRAVAGWRGRALDRDVRSLAGRHRATYVDIAGQTGPTMRRRPGRYFAADRFHPNDAGYALWAQAVVAAVDGRSGR
jgi:lysophospholipase L1-like esterase